MRVELVQAAMPDGLRLDGAWHAVPAGVAPSAEVDTVLCLHGTGSNFYGSSLWRGLIPRLLDAGLAVLAVNTRGHDGVSITHGPEGRRLLGSAYERVDDCRLDVAGWLQLALERGAKRVALLGHSLGAVKAVYALAHEAHLPVARVVAISPPRLSYSFFKAQPRGAAFVEEHDRAAALVAEGRPDELMDVRFPIPYLVTAAGYLDKYGVAERYHLLKFAGRVACPLLCTFGSAELQQGMAFRGLPEELEALAATGANVRVDVVAGGDHVYSGVHAELAARVVRWLRR